jgi:membrane peptidoglycan carboxypeptidase
LIDDKPLAIGTGNGAEVYRPVNYDGKFHGKVTLRQALANSYNIPAVSLLKSMNIDDMVNLGKNMGLKNWEADGNYGLSITLGGKETRLLDLTNVYGTLARMGEYTDTKPVLFIKDSKGREVYRYSLTKSRVLPEDVAYIIANILSDNFARTPAFGFNNLLQVPGHSVAVKTGTTDLKRDNYTVGYTPSYVVGVWVGNNNNAPMNQNLASGLTGAAPAWNKIMSYLLNGTQNEEFAIPSNIVVKQYCKGRKEVYIRGTEPKNTECDDQDKEKDSKKDKNN